MLSSKFYLLLALLFIFVSYSLSTDQKPRKGGDSVLDGKKKTAESDNDDIRRKEKIANDDYDDDEVDDHLIGALSFADNRYSPFNPPEGNYRTRARWPQAPSAAAVPSSPFDDLMNGNDWSRMDFSNIFSSPSSSLPSMSYDTNPTLGSTSSCSSVVDSQYPIFSDVCGAVPQARYALPNALGHRERWQVAHTLSMLLSSTSDAACTRSVRLLLCPVLFPPCPSRHEPPAVLPCQSYCRAVKARCAIPTLDLLPCEVLPLSSDLCPTNQAYGSFVPPPSAVSSVNQQSQVNNALPTSNFPMPRSYPSLQSLLSSQGLQSVSQPTATQNLFNSNPFGSDSLSPMLVDFPSRSYNNDFRQAQKYPPLTRSATDVRSKAETKYPTGQRPSAVPSQILA